MNSAKAYVRLVHRMMKQDAITETAAVWRTLLRIGESYTEKDVDWKASHRLAKRYRTEIRCCYWNCLRIARLRPELEYCEGFATVVIPTEHAWLLDRERNVIIDPTWCLSVPGVSNLVAADSLDYFGITIPSAEAEIFHTTNPWEPAWLPPVLREIQRKKKQTKTDRRRSE